ncbi:MAG: Bax inhibitor-1/YccA family protein [Phycisphaerales bacterium]|nr:Bax inhibitor-1/YccA family protein [Phycisphaerales bacterium]
MRTSNPVLNSKAFDVPGWEHLDAAASQPRTMTIQGTVNAAFILIMLTMASAIGGWYLIQNQIVSPFTLVLPGALAGLVLSLIMFFAPKTSPFLSPLYAIVEGVFLGGLSLLMQASLAKKLGPAASGVVFQAVLLTFGIFISLLLAYKFRLVRVGKTLGTCVMIGTAGIGILYLISMVLGMTGMGSIGFIHSSSNLGIAFTAGVVILASLNLVMDFQSVEAAAERGSPKYMEWYAAFGVLTTLIWLYIELLRLLAKIADRR